MSKIFVLHTSETSRRTVDEPDTPPLLGCDGFDVVVDGDEQSVFLVIDQTNEIDVALFDHAMHSSDFLVEN